MKPCLSVFLAGAIIAVSAAAATPAAADAQRAPGAYPIDCAKEKDAARCEVLNRKIEVCRDKVDEAWRECMQQAAPAAEFTPPRPRDCSVARNRAGCEAHAVALEACKDSRTRAEHRKCVAGQLQASAPGRN